MSKFYIQTYGCQMNVADSDRMTALLERAGGEAVERPEDADLILLNTCSVREKPEVKVYSRLGELRKLKQKNPELVLGVCGCQAQREGENILKNAPFVDLVLGTANVDRVPELVDQVRRTGDAQARDTLLDDAGSAHDAGPGRPRSGRSGSRTRETQGICTDHPRLRLRVHLLHRAHYARTGAEPARSGRAG